MEEERYGHINATGDDRPLLKNLHDHVVQKVAHKWKDLGVQLLRLDQQEALRIIELDHPRDTVECCKRVLEKWLDTTTDATWNQLISALRSPTVELDYLANQIENMMVVKMKATTSSSSDQGTCNKFTTFEEMEVEFAIMTNRIKQALINNKVNVDSLIEQLCTISTVNNKNVPLFDENVFVRIRSVDEFWKSLRTFWNIYDYDLLRFIVKITKCAEAKNILEEFLSRIDPSTLRDVDLVLHCRVDQREGSLMPTLRIKINAEECTYDIQEKVKKIVSKKFDLEEYAFQFKGIKNGCIELLYHVSKPVKSYLLQYTIDEGSLTKFSTYKIISLHIDDVDIFKLMCVPAPMDEGTSKEHSNFGQQPLVSYIETDDTVKLKQKSGDAMSQEVYRKQKKAKQNKMLQRRQQLQQYSVLFSAKRQISRAHTHKLKRLKESLSQKKKLYKQHLLKQGQQLPLLQQLPLSPPLPERSSRNSPPPPPPPPPLR